MIGKLSSHSSAVACLLAALATTPALAVEPKQGTALCNLTLGYEAGDTNPTASVPLSCDLESPSVCRADIGGREVTLIGSSTVGGCMRSFTVVVKHADGTRTDVESTGELSTTTLRTSEGGWLAVACKVELSVAILDPTLRCRPL